MPKSKFTAEQISKILEEAKPRGSTLAVARKYGISDKTIINWRQKFRNQPPESIKNQKVLEAENSRLKKIVANMAMDIELLKEINSKKW